MNLLNSERPTRPVRRRLAAGVAAAVIAGSTVVGAGLMPAAQAVDPATLSGVVLGVSATESQRVVSWYSSANTAQVVQVGPASTFPAGATGFPATVAANIVNGGYNGHTTINGLQENTSYSYRIGADGAWSPTYSFKTRAFDGDFDFLFFGDPQIGSSGNTAEDGAGWADTLNVALGANPDAELLVSGGDQVETANTETQWSAFLAPTKLTQYPWAATIGNHDVGGLAYQQHFWTPNTDRSTAFYKTPGSATESGGDYWYIYKDVLFIDLNSNAYKNGSDAAHINYVTNVVKQHGADAKYTVLAYHHAIYSPADHANDADNQVRRQDFPTAFSRLGVDLVLQGHDHSYSRSYVIKNGQKAHDDERPGDADVAQGPGGVVYVTANSASGSKYYDLTDPIPGSDFGPDPLNPDNHWANSVENQEHVRTYVKVEVRKNRLVVENVRSGTCVAPNSAVEFHKVSWCGPDSGASPAQPVGSQVDSVVIHPFRGNDGYELPASSDRNWSVSKSQDADGQQTVTLTSVS
jgi:hypothetical protein